MQVELASFAEIGAYLRDVREAIGMDVKEVGQQLNIRPKYLEAIEAGKLEVLPGKTYARGYMKNYAEWLGVPPSDIVSAFDRCNRGGGNVRYFVPEPTEKHYQPGIMVVLIALALIGGVYVYWLKNHNEVVVPDRMPVTPVPDRLLDPAFMQSLDNDREYIMDMKVAEPPESVKPAPSPKAMQELPWLREKVKEKANVAP